MKILTRKTLQTFGVWIPPAEHGGIQGTRFLGISVPSFHRIVDQDPIAQHCSTRLRMDLAVVFLVSWK